MSDIIASINSVLWGPFSALIFIGCGAFLTFKSSFLQIRRFPDMIRAPFSAGSRSEAGITAFRSVSTALAGTMGVGNIIGVSAAIVSGGAGAIFWMWVSAFFGMMTKYAEAVLAVRFRRVLNGKNYGGAMFYISDGAKMPFSALLFSVFCALASFGVGNMAQVGPAADALRASLGIPEQATGVIIAVFTAVVIFGGIGRVATVAAAVIPALSVLYVLMSSAVIFANLPSLPGAFAAILIKAFSFRSAGSGIFGFLTSKAIRFGLARGIFTNEAGMGSSAAVHAASSENSPAKQGLSGMFEVFADTFVITTLTALVILVSVGENFPQTNGVELAITAFSSLFGRFGKIAVAVSLFFFAIPSILGWAYYGERAVAYIFKENAAAITVYRIIFSLLAYAGAVALPNIVWEISDTFNFLMALPNLAAIMLLSKKVIAETQHFFSGQERHTQKRSSPRHPSQ